MERRWRGNPDRKSRLPRHKLVFAAQELGVMKVQLIERGVKWHFPAFPHPAPPPVLHKLGSYNFKACVTKFLPWWSSLEELILTNF